MEKISYLQAFVRNGRIIFANSDELNALLKDKEDYFIIVPVAFDTEHVQIRKVDAEEIKNLLPNTILTSPFEPYIDNAKKTTLSLNSIPFTASKLIADAKKLAETFNMSKLFGL